MIDHEPSISSATRIGLQAAGVAEFDSRSKHPGRSMRTMSPCPAVGRRVQVQRRRAHCQSSLYKRPELGQTFTVRWSVGAAGPQTTLRGLLTRIHRCIHVNCTTTNTSRLNLVESYFATLQRTALHNIDYGTTQQIEPTPARHGISKRQSTRI